jgi:hypothetical protein
MLVDISLFYSIFGTSNPSNLTLPYLTSLYLIRRHGVGYFRGLQRKKVKLPAFSAPMNPA